MDRINCEVNISIKTIFKNNISPGVKEDLADRSFGAAFYEIQNT